MANVSYMKVTGKQQGLISAGCSGITSLGTKCQLDHEDEIMVLSLTHNMVTGNGGVESPERSIHMPLVITKHIDKSSPLLAKAHDAMEELKCEIDLYRTSPAGHNERYYTIMLDGARITTINSTVPHAIHNSGGQPQEIVSFRYRNISWVHHEASTLAYSSWGEQYD